MSSTSLRKRRTRQSTTMFLIAATVKLSLIIWLVVREITLGEPALLLPIAGALQISAIITMLIIIAKNTANKNKKPRRPSFAVTHPEG